MKSLLLCVSLFLCSCAYVPDRVAASGQIHKESYEFLSSSTEAIARSMLLQAETRGDIALADQLREFLDLLEADRELSRSLADWLDANSDGDYHEALRELREGE